MKTISTISLALMAGVASAQVPPQSDELRISNAATGAVLLDIFLLEAAGASESGVYNLPGFANGVAPPGSVVPGLAAVRAYVALLEPLNDPVDPGTTPIFIVIPGVGTRQLSDLVISFISPLDVGVAFLSDADPALPQWVAALALNNNPNLRFVEETGQLQDVSAFLQTPYRVQVASDVAAVPEPASYALLAGGLALLLAKRRRGT